jgi:hypothetical protein
LIGGQGEDARGKQSPARKSIQFARLWIKMI